MNFRVQNTRKIAVSLAIISLLVFWSGVCLIAGKLQKLTNNKTDLEFWVMGATAEVVREMISEFEQEYPDIRVNVQGIPWANAHEKLLTSLIGGTMPDVFQIGNTWIPEFTLLNGVEDLTHWVSQSSVIQADDFYSGIWSTSEVDGKVYSIPWYVDTRLIFYRKDILEKAGYTSPPTTWAEWADVLSDLSKGMEGDRYPILLPIDEFEIPIIFALQQEGEMLRENATLGDFQGDAFRRAFTFYIHMFENGWTPKVRRNQIANIEQEFGRGYFVFYITGAWNISRFKSRLPLKSAYDWQTAPMPGPESGPGVSMAGGASLAISRNSDLKADAWTLIEFLSRPEIQVRFYKAMGNLPVLKSSWDEATLKSDPHLESFRIQVHHMRPLPRVPEWERISNVIKLYAEEVIYERMTIDEALTGLDQTVDRFLEKRRLMINHQDE